MSVFQKQNEREAWETKIPHTARFASKQVFFWKRDFGNKINQAEAFKRAHLFSLSQRSGLLVRGCFLPPSCGVFILGVELSRAFDLSSTLGKIAQGFQLNERDTMYAFLRQREMSFLPCYFSKITFGKFVSLFDSERVTEREWDLLLLAHLPVPAAATAVCQKPEPGTWFCPLGSRNQALGPSSIAFPAALAGSWIRKQSSRFSNWHSNVRCQHCKPMACSTPLQ